MTSPIREVTVNCPKCEQTYEAWYRPSINLDLDDFDDAYVDAASSAVCPSCGHKVYFANLIVLDDVFYADDTDEPEGSVCEQPGT